jgi:hypothetical protein
MTANKTLFVSLSLLLSVTWLCAEAYATEAQTPRIQLPSQDSPEYWVLRSEAVRELTRFMTRKRTELKRKYAYFPRYLKQIGKLEDFGSKRIKVPDDPRYRLAILGVLDTFEQKNVKLPQKPLSWNQVIDVSMQFVWAEGHLATDVETGEELQSFKDILQSRERFCREVRAEVKEIVDAGIRAWFYLGTIDQQQGFGAYLLQQEAERKEAFLKKRAERAAQVKEEMRQDEQAFQAREQMRQNERLAQERAQMEQYNRELRSAQLRDQIKEYEEDLRQDRLRIQFGYGY